MTRALAVSVHSAAEPQAVHGVYQRLDMIMRALCATSDAVDFLSLNPPHAGDARAERVAWESVLRRRWGDNVSLLEPAPPRSAPPSYLFWPGFVRGLFDYRAVEPVAKVDLAAARRALAAALELKPDMIFAHRLGSMAPLLRAARDHRLPPVVFDMDDIEHIARVRRARDPMTPVRDRMRVVHTPALSSGARRAVPRASATLVCSEHDRSALQRLQPTAAIRVISNAVDIVEAEAAAAGAPTVMFVGSFDYRPNVVAAQELVTAIWPQVRALVPAARLRIVGNRAHRVPVSAAPPDGVEFTGFVDDLAAEYRRAHVVCCPIRSGGGTRVKIIEAAAFGLPVVSTTLGAEGLAFLPGTEIQIEDSPQGLARACVELLQDPQRAQRMAAAARERVVEHYDRRAVSRQLQDVFRSVFSP